MPRNIWTRYNFCPPNQMQQLVFLHLLRFKDFFLYRRSLTARQGSSNQSTSSQTQKSGLASPLPGGTCTHSFLPFHLHFFQCSSISFPVPPICELLCPTSSHPKKNKTKKPKTLHLGAFFTSATLLWSSKGKRVAAPTLVSAYFLRYVFVGWDSVRMMRGQQQQQKQPCMQEDLLSYHPSPLRDKRSWKSKAAHYLVKKKKEKGRGEQQ